MTDDVMKEEKKKKANLDCPEPATKEKKAKSIGHYLLGI